MTLIHTLVILIALIARLHAAFMTEVVQMHFLGQPTFQWQARPLGQLRLREMLLLGTLTISVSNAGQETMMILR